MSRFIPGAQKPSDGAIVKGSNRKITPWAEIEKKNHSIHWLIEHACTEEMLIDVLKFANYQTNASADTRRAWANASERKIFILRANPPTYEPITLNDTGLARWKEEEESFKTIRDAEMRKEIARLSPPEAFDSREVTADGPLVTPRSPQTQALIDAAEVPRPVDALVLAEAVKSRELAKTAKHGDKVFSIQEASTVTEILEIEYRTKCPPPDEPGETSEFKGRPTWDARECVYSEADVRFLRAGIDVTAKILAESNPLTMFPSRRNPGCATFSFISGNGVIDWKCSVERRFGLVIPYQRNAGRVPAPYSAIAMGMVKMIEELDKPPQPPAVD